MEDEDALPQNRETPDQFHARRRRERRDLSRSKSPPPVEDERHYVYGLHAVREALNNTKRRVIKLHVTRNALARLELSSERAQTLPIEESTPKELDKLVHEDAVHQGVILQTEPLEPMDIHTLGGDARLVLVLDQVTDPHNVGAIMRSAVAMNADALITTARHSPAQTGVLAKAASGALEIVSHIIIRNLADGLESLNRMGFTTIGLDSAGDKPLEAIAATAKVAIVLGAEGKGLRQKTRTTCEHLARLDMPGEIKSLNVSNASVLALYVARNRLLLQE